MPRRHNGVPYRGVNVLLLWCAGSAMGYTSPHWLSFKQALEPKGNVRKGEHGSLVVYADKIKRTETNSAGEEVEIGIPFMKGYTVFNVEQVEGLPRPLLCPCRPAARPAARIDHADRFFANTGADIRHRGDRAYYAQERDYVQMPPFVSFRDAESHRARWPTS